MGDYHSAMDDWHNFVDETKTDYGVDMHVLTKPFSEEQRKYYLQVGSLYLVHFKIIYIFIKYKFEHGLGSIFSY